MVVKRIIMVLTTTGIEATAAVDPRSAISGDITTPKETKKIKICALDVLSSLFLVTRPIPFATASLKPNTTRTRPIISRITGQEARRPADTVLLSVCRRAAFCKSNNQLKRYGIPMNDTLVVALRCLPERASERALKT